MILFVIGDGIAGQRKEVVELVRWIVSEKYDRLIVETIPNAIYFEDTITASLVLSLHNEWRKKHETQNKEGDTPT